MTTQLSRIQQRALLTGGASPTAGNILSREIQVSYLDGQLWVGDNSVTPLGVPLIGMKIWLATASYQGGDIVNYAGSIYSAKAPITPEAFTPAHWNQLTSHPIPPDAQGSLTNNGSGTLSWTPMLPLAGGTLTGPAIAAADPTTALGLVTKQYADAITTTTNTALATKLPLAGGTMTGSLVLASAPTTTLQAATKGYADLMLPLAGGTMTGTLTLAASPSSALQAATKQYADLMVPLAGGVMTGALTLSAAPTTTLQAATKGYADALPGALAPFRNQIHNGQFTVAQRSGGPFTTAGFGIDRWNALTGTGGGTRSYTVFTLADADRTAIGDEEATFCAQGVIAGGSGAGDFDIYQQAIEGLRRYTGKSVTVSFWAKVSSGTSSLGVNLTSYFGTGGSPSTTLYNTVVTKSVTSTWQKFNTTFAIASASGKTFGTNNDSSLNLIFGFSSGTTNAPTYGVGVQSATFQIWGVQLEVSTTVSTLEKRPPTTEIAFCQRYYQVGDWYIAGYAAIVCAPYSYISFPVQMRAIPTIGYTIPYYTGATAAAPLPLSNRSVACSITSSGAGNYSGGGTYTASAEI
jgi:hypothetical protein